MNINLEKLKDHILNNDSISAEDKKKFYSYFDEYLLKRISFLKSEDYSNFDNLLKAINYNYEYFDRLVYTSFKIRNSINFKNKVNKTLIPDMNYVLSIYRIFTELDMNLFSYDFNDGVANVSIARTVSLIYFNNEMIEDGVSIFDIVKDVYNIHNFTGDKNMCVILRVLNRANKGFRELDSEYSFPIHTYEFYSMLEHVWVIDSLNISDIIKQYYPIFNNELFSLIKNVISSSPSEDINTVYVMGYLSNVYSKRKSIDVQKEKILQEVERIDVEAENNVEQAFSKLISSIETNSNINERGKNAVLENIKNVFERYRNEQISFVDKQLDNFFNNCSNYINDLIIPSSIKNNEINLLITDLVNNCKDFFVEYDSKKFKEIVNYVLDNTDISVEQLKLIGEKCSNFFKDADVNKLSAIKLSLKEFNDYVSENYKDSDFVECIFEEALINSPDLLLNNKLNEVVGFLKGEISLGEYGYQHPNFSIKKDFLSSNFFKRMKGDGYKILFKGSISKLINNLNYLSERCSSLGIDFMGFNFNDNMIYNLLNNDFYSEGTNALDSIVSLFDIKDIQNLIELNPDLLMISDEHLEWVAAKCLLNENEEYNFCELLASELYYYNYNSYTNKTKEEIFNSGINIVSLDINKRDYNVMDILTSNLFKTSDSDLLFKQYEDRENTKKALEAIIKDIENISFDDSVDLYQMVVTVKNLCDSLYGKVPNVSFMNKIISVLDAKKTSFAGEIDSLTDDVEGKSTIVKSYDEEIIDRDVAIKTLKDLSNSLNSKTVKNELKKFLAQHMKEKESTVLNVEEMRESIKKIEASIQLLSKRVDELALSLSIIDFDNICLIEEKKHDVSKSFTMKDLDNMLPVFSEKEEVLEEALDGRNLIIFADQVDLSEIPNDKNFVEKVHKFIGDGDFSITSRQFIRLYGGNSDYIKKFTDQRSEIFERREDRTQVRVYFIPVNNKYFGCYYVVGVNYKDHAHKDAGCSTDKVYNRRVSEAERLKQIINELGEKDIGELAKWIKKYNVMYYEQMMPIVSKLECDEKKRNNKK